MARHIVIVEDEAAIRHNYEDALHRYGYKVSGYGDKNSALAALKRRLPDLVIIDVGVGDGRIGNAITVEVAAGTTATAVSVGEGPHETSASRIR